MANTNARKLIDWQKTGANLLGLRNDNLQLRRYVCRELGAGGEVCAPSCADCKFELDDKISRAELALVIGVSENTVMEWESGNTPVSLEEMLFYCQMAAVDLTEIVVYR